MDLWTDDELYALAQNVHPRRHTEQKMPSLHSLQDLCFDLVIEMLETWTELNKQHGINAFEKLSPTLRDELLDYHFANYIVCDYELKLLLLNAQTKSLILDIRDIGDLEQCASFLAKVVSKAPNLELLQLIVENLFADDPSFIKTSIFNAIVGFKNLNHLDLGYAFGLNNDDLMLVTDNFPNLVSLNVCLEASSIRLAGFQNISNLKKLQVFNFSFYRSDTYPGTNFKNSTISWIYSWCAQHLPQLKMIDVDLGTTEQPEKITPIFSGTSSLEALQSAHFLPAASLPNLETLVFHGEIKDAQFFAKIFSYTNLTSLEVHNVKMDELDQILEFFGKQLTSLTCVTGDQSDFDCFKIVHFCPNLIKLCILLENPKKTVDSKFRELVSSRNLRCLESVTFGSIFHETVLPQGFLKFIFEAPAIEEINIRRYSLKKEDCRLVDDFVEGRFQKLEYVFFNDLQLEPGCTYDDLGLMVKLIVCGAPNLKQVVIDWEPISATTELFAWKEYPNGAKKFVQLLKEK